MTVIVKNSVSVNTLNQSQINALLCRKNPKKVSLRGIILTREQLEKAYSRGISLKGVILIGLDLTGINLNGANLSGAKLKDVELDGANLENTILKKADMCNANLDKVNFTGANLSGVNFSGATAESANLQRAILGGANFKDTFFGKANFKNAILRGVNFKNAYLNGAKITDEKRLEIYRKKERDRQAVFERLLDPQDGNKKEKDKARLVLGKKYDKIMKKLRKENPPTENPEGQVFLNTDGEWLQLGGNDHWLTIEIISEKIMGKYATIVTPQDYFNLGLVRVWIEWGESVVIEGRGRLNSSQKYAVEMTMIRNHKTSDDVCFDFGDKNYEAKLKRQLQW